MTDPWLFLLGVLTLLATPGPTNTLLASGGAMAGFRRSLPLLIGELGGYLVGIALIRLVLGPLFSALPLLASALKIVVALYLVWVAAALWREARSITAPVNLVTVRRVFVTTLFNPKALIFSLSVFPPTGPAIWPYVLGFCLCTLSCGSAWIAIGHAAGTVAGQGRQSLFPRIGAVALAGFAGLIVYSVFR